MKLKHFTILIPFFIYSGALSAKTIFNDAPNQKKAAIAAMLFSHHEQANSELAERTNYIWPIFVSPLSLASKDEFFTLVKKTELPDKPGRFIISPAFTVSDAVLSNKDELKSYFSNFLLKADPEAVGKAIAGLKPIEIEGAQSNHYLIPIIKMEDLLALANKKNEGQIILFELPETESDAILEQEKMLSQNTIMSDPLIELTKELSSYYDFMNFARVEEVKDYIRKFEKTGNPWAGDFYSITK